MDDVVGCTAVRECEAGCACATWADGKAVTTCEVLVRDCDSISVLLPTSTAVVDAPSRTLGATTAAAVAGSGTKTRLEDSDSAGTRLLLAFSTPNTVCVHAASLCPPREVMITTLSARSVVLDRAS